jgi:hypothetical protein
VFITRSQDLPGRVIHQYPGARLNGRWRHGDGKSLAANAQETLEASKVTAIKKRPFNGISSKLTDSPSFLRKFSFQIRV